MLFTLKRFTLIWFELVSMYFCFFLSTDIAGIASVDGVGRPQLNLIDSFEKKRSDQLTAISSRP